MQNKNNTKSTLIKIFDILFIMILCFATLFVTMKNNDSLLNWLNPNKNNIYSFELISFIVMVVCFIAYLIYIISNSNKELKNMIAEIYDEEKKD
jgi:amino acid transporter